MRCLNARHRFYQPPRQNATRSDALCALLSGHAADMHAARLLMFSRSENAPAIMADYRHVTANSHATAMPIRCRGSAIRCSQMRVHAGKRAAKEALHARVASVMRAAGVRGA